MTKICSKCGGEFPATLEYFVKSKTCKDRLASYCKLCTRAESKRYNKENKISIAERRKKHYNKNKEILLERSKKYHHTNKEKIANYYRQKYKNHLNRVNRLYIELCGALICSYCKKEIIDSPHFHHIDPTTKLYGIADMVSKSDKELIEELNKCVPICNEACHMKLHTGEENEQNRRFCEETGVGV